MPSLDQVHDLLDKHNAWDKSFHVFHDLISVTMNGSHTHRTSYDQRELKERWDIVQYIKKRYGGG